MTKYNDGQQRKMEAFYGSEALIQQDEYISQLESRLKGLQQANVILLKRANDQESLNRVLMARLSAYNISADPAILTPDDLKFLKAVGIKA